MLPVFFGETAQVIKKIRSAKEAID